MRKESTVVSQAQDAAFCTLRLIIALLSASLTCQLILIPTQGALLWTAAILCKI